MSHLIIVIEVAQSTNDDRTERETKVLTILERG